MFELIMLLSIGQCANGVCRIPPTIHFPPAHVVQIAKDCPCSPLCTCGCNQGMPCRCGNPSPVTRSPFQPTIPPAQPDEAVEAKGEPLNFGVKDDMRGKEPVYRINGRRVERREAFESLAKDGKLVDDSKKYRITLIGTPDDCKRVRDQMKGTDLERDCLTQTYSPDHWAVKDAGFKLTGSPVVYMQAPDGKVLHRQDDAEGAIEALRKARPDYKPEADPNGKSNPIQPLDPSKLPWYIWPIGAGVLWLLLKPEDKSK